MLFNITINDFTEIFDEKCGPVIIGNYNLKCLLYADNLLLLPDILSETVNGLKECIARLSHYGKVWKLSVNLKETKIMIFNGRTYFYCCFNKYVASFKLQEFKDLSKPKNKHRRKCHPGKLKSCCQVTITHQMLTSIIRVL